MGGILRTLNILGSAEKIGINYIIGSQVGETSLLTRAALTVANAHPDNLLAQEGAYGTYLLQKDVLTPTLMFGRGGLVTQGTISTLSGQGFGLTYTG